MNDYIKVAEVELSYRPLRCFRPKIEDGRVASQVFIENWDDGQIAFRESVKIMLLNIRGNCMGICTLADGGGSSCGVDIRHALQTALVSNAHRIILCHNHPSGELRPSSADDDLTQKLMAGCKAVGIKLVDHIIVEPNGDYYSYNENGKINGR